MDQRSEEKEGMSLRVMNALFVDGFHLIAGPVIVCLQEILF